MFAKRNFDCEYQASINFSQAKTKVYIIIVMLSRGIALRGKELGNLWIACADFNVGL
jgi:hypothetical protein